MMLEEYHPDHGYGSTLGSILIGALLATALYGNTCTLVVSYFHKRSQDHWAIKITVLLLWVMTTVSICLFSHSVYWFLVIHFDDRSVIGPKYLPWTLLSQSALVGVISFVVRGMFALRLWKLSRRDLLVTVSVVMLSAANLVSLILVTVESLMHSMRSANHDIANLDRFLEVAFGTSVAADVALTAALCYYLWRSRTHFAKTDSVISELTLYTFNTGLLVVVDIVLSLVLFMTVSKPNGNLVFIPTYIVSAGLYLNSFFVSLNARDTFREKLVGSYSVPLALDRSDLENSPEQLSEELSGIDITENV